MTPLLSRMALGLCLPIACAWVSRQEYCIRREGVPLSAALLQDARNVGVKFPDRVRLLVVNEVPRIHPWLRFFARKFGLCSPATRGMSLRYGIFIRSDCWGERALVIHELAHTAQYERLGGVWAFLRNYLYECIVTPGYPWGPLEQEAATVARRICA
jgi:hypothetical protein